jgi:glutamate synthase (ferredoxin)
LNKTFTSKYFPYTPSRIEGIGLMEVEKKSKKDIKSLSNSKVSNLLPLEIGGVYRWRDQAKSICSTTTISKLQQAVRLNSPESYKVL